MRVWNRKSKTGKVWLFVLTRHAKSGKITAVLLEGAEKVGSAKTEQEALRQAEQAIWQKED